MGHHSSSSSHCILHTPSILSLMTQTVQLFQCGTHFQFLSLHNSRKLLKKALPPDASLDLPRCSSAATNTLPADRRAEHEEPLLWNNREWCWIDRLPPESCTGKDQKKEKEGGRRTLAQSSVLMQVPDWTGGGARKGCAGGSSSTP